MMKKMYVKPAMLCGNEARGLIPVVAAVAGALGVSQAVAGLGVGAVAGLGAVAAGTAAAKKAGNGFVGRESLPALDLVEVYA